MNKKVTYHLGVCVCVCVLAVLRGRHLMMYGWDVWMGLHDRCRTAADVPTEERRAKHGG